MATQEATKRALAKTSPPQSLEQLIEKSAKEFKKALPVNMRPERLVRIALTCIRQIPKLAECTPASFVGALLVAAQLGLEPVAGRAYIIPFWNNKLKRLEAQFVIGYRGLADLFYRHERSVGLSWGVVKDGDEFSYEYGTAEYLRHRPVSNNGEAIGYYVIAELKGTKKFKYMTKVECIAHGRKHSKTFDSRAGDFLPDSPWKTETDVMCLKTTLIQLGKILPLSIELQRAIAQDETSREYREGIDDALDIPLSEWTAEDMVEISEERRGLPGQHSDPLLSVGSTLHKAVEAMVNEEGWDRGLIHEYLFQQGNIELNGEGKPSFATMPEEFARSWLDNRQAFARSFATWVSKKDGSAQD